MQNSRHIEWDAEWIGLPSGEIPPGEHRSLLARYLRREFIVSKPLKRATARVCGLGVFDFSINSRSPDDRLHAPGYTYFSRRALYVEWDVTSLLHRGPNALGVVIGNGRFFAPREKSPTPFTDFGAPRMLCRIDLEYMDGYEESIVSDPSWKATDMGPLRFNNEYDGEIYDARLEMPGWDAPGFDDSAWKPADRMDAPTNRLDLHDYPPDRITEILNPVSIEPRGDGCWMVDFGQNFYGCVRCHVRGPSGHDIRWTSSYSLDPDGNLRLRDNRDALSCDRYILRGNGSTETWNPRFRGQGMRRVLVENWPGEFTKDSLEGLVIHADMKPVGEFTCSSPLFNRLWQNIRWGQRMYRRQGAPLDPDRNERQGWLGDVCMNAGSDIYNWDAHLFFRKWLVDIQLDQREDGCLPDVSPNVWQFYSDNIDWPAAYLIINSLLLQYYGDNENAARHLPNIERWLRYLKDRLVLPDGTVNANTYTDWCDASTMGTEGHKSSHSSPEFISSAYWCLVCRETARLARRLGRDSTVIDEWFKASLRGFLNRFVDLQTGSTPGNTQCELAILLGMKLAPLSLQKKVAENLTQAIRSANNCPTVGLVGMQWLMSALEHEDCEEAAFALVSNENRPGWGYMIRQGATTIWENWDTDTRDPGMNSEALLLLAGGLNAWFFRGPGGIRQAPDSEAFSRIILAPMTGTLSSVAARYDSIRGRIVSHWSLADGRFSWDIEIPPGSPAEIHFPRTCQGPYLMDGLPVESSVVEVPPGRHHLNASVK